MKRSRASRSRIAPFTILFLINLISIILHRAEYNQMTGECDSSDESLCYIIAVTFHRRLEDTTVVLRVVSVDAWHEEFNELVRGEVQRGSQQQLLILNIHSTRCKIHDHSLKSITEDKAIKRDFKNNATLIRKSTINSQISLISPDTQRTQDYSPHLSQSS
jgi:hypothetical protein